MTNQPGVSGNAGVPIAGAAAVSGAFDTGDDEQTDNGVPVGEADAEADRKRASRELDSSGNDDPDDDLGRGTTTDAGVPVGSADAEEDRRRASGDVSEDT